MTTSRRPSVVARNLGKLVFGSRSSASELSDSLLHLRSTFEALLTEMMIQSRANTRRVSLFGPYLGRSLLEVGLTGLIARLDPFRVLTLRRVQMDPEYGLGRRIASAIQWTGDISTKEGATAKWDADRDAMKFSRAILDDYWATLAWKDGFVRLLDELAESEHTTPWIVEIKATPPEDFVKTLRGRMNATYSALSKGVHNEFVISRTALYDAPTVLDLMRDAVKHISSLALVSHLIDHACFAVPPSQAIRLFSSIDLSET